MSLGGIDGCCCLWWTSPRVIEALGASDKPWTWDGKREVGLMTLLKPGVVSAFFSGFFCVGSSLCS